MQDLCSLDPNSAGPFLVTCLTTHPFRKCCNFKRNLLPRLIQVTALYSGKGGHSCLLVSSVCILYLFPMLQP